MESYEFIQRIPSHYVGEDCIQIMIPHINDAITILNSDGMTYHYKPNSEFFVNKYISDERKEQFLYSQIPTHKDKKDGKKIEYINQLMDFNRVYIKISDGLIVERYVIKDGDEALLATKTIMPNKNNVIMNRRELYDLFATANGGLYSFNGTKWESAGIVSDEKVLEWYKKHLISIREQEERFRNGSNPTDKTLTEFIYRSIEKLTPADVPLKPTLLDNMILVSIGENEIKSIRSLIVKFESQDKYDVEIWDFPITIYSYEHMKYLEQTNLVETKEPIISASLNPQIDSNVMKKVKRFVSGRK